MLAKPYSKKRGVKFPVLVQPKINGIRGTFCPDTRLFYTKAGNILHTTTVIEKHLVEKISKVLKLVPFDGELLIPNIPFQKSNGLVRRKRNIDEVACSKMVFNIFDIALPDLSFYQRKDLVGTFFDVMADSLDPLERQNFSLVETYTAENQEQIDTLHKKFFELGYEGSIYRTGAATYHFSDMFPERSLVLQKRKDFFKMTVKVTGFEEGQDRLTNTLGAFQVKDKENRFFKIGSGLNDFTRNFAWNNKDAVMGKDIKISYLTLTERGVPFHASFKGFVK
jgi:hypothetical protein